MKGIIIGAGLSGLSTAIALRKYIQTSQHLEIKIYDNTHLDYSTDHSQPSLKVATSRLGAGLGLQANGLRELGDLDPALRDKVYAAGFACTHFTGRHWLLRGEYFDALPNSRPLLISILQDALPKGAVTYKTVSKVVTRQGQKPVIQFEGGSPDEVADLIVGADGIRSTVRHDLFGDNEKR
ncbi:FAD/NAD(P)-binding domain-containing protein [Whalleya microplaca]|nr:FAD/NAD(P)-binding domain-containing protein [Whalleya microplaca]